MVIEKHLNIAYMLHEVKKPAGKRDIESQIVFVFENRIEFEVASVNEFRFAGLLAFVSDFFVHLFVDVRFNCMNSFNLYKFSGIFKYFRHFVPSKNFLKISST